MNVDKIDYMCFNQKENISTLNGRSLKLVNKFTYCCILTFDSAKQAIPKEFELRKEVTHSDGSYERKSRWRAWLTKWDKVKNPMVHS